MDRLIVDFTRSPSIEQFCVVTTNFLSGIVIVYTPRDEVDR